MSISSFQNLYKVQMDAVRALHKWSSDAFQVNLTRQQHTISDTLNDVSVHWKNCLQQSSPLGLLDVYLQYVEKRLPKLHGGLQENIDFSSYSHKEIQNILTKCQKHYMETTRQALAMVSGA